MVWYTAWDGLKKTQDTLKPTYGMVWYGTNHCSHLPCWVPGDTPANSRKTFLSVSKRATIQLQVRWYRGCSILPWRWQGVIESRRTPLLNPYNVPRGSHLELHFLLFLSCNTPLLSWKMHVSVSTDMGMKWEWTRMQTHLQHAFTYTHRIKSCQITNKLNIPT